VTNFKFLHAADIHLDSALRGLSRYEGVPAEQVRTATRDALDNLVTAAIEDQVAFVIIAGDLYDGDWDHFGTGLFFCAAMGRLEKAGIEVFLLFGNHDADSVLTKKLPLPPNVRVFGHRKAETLLHDATGTALHGRSYKDRDPGENLAAGYPDALAGHFNIGVLHTALTGGRPPHAPYSPCTPDELAAKEYDYWALGHVHQHEVVSISPHIVFPGNLQGRNIRECGPKGAVLVEVQDGDVKEVRHLALDVVRWSRAEVDLTDAESDAAVYVRVREGLREVLNRDSDGRPLMVRVILSGRTEAHGALMQKTLLLREEVRAIATALSDEIWIEKVVLATRGAGAAMQVGTVVDDLADLLAVGLEDDELQTQIRSDFADFLARIPSDLGAEDSVLQKLRAGDLAELLQDATASLQARLVGETG